MRQLIQKEKGTRSDECAEKTRAKRCSHLKESRRYKDIYGSAGSVNKRLYRAYSESHHICNKSVIMLLDSSGWTWLHSLLAVDANDVTRARRPLPQRCGSGHVSSVLDRLICK